MVTIQSLIAILIVYSLLAILLLPSYQISVATPLRNCSFEIGQYTLDEIWNVASESMFPLLRPGDLVATDKNLTFEDVQIGDIRVFREPIPSDEEPRAIVSRLIEMINDPVDQIVLVTKGDANSNSIPCVDFPIYERNFIGVVEYSPD